MSNLYANGKKLSTYVEATKSRFFMDSSNKFVSFTGDFII